MRKQWMIGSLAVAVLGLAGMRAVTLAQRPAKVWVPAGPMPYASKAEPAPTESNLLPMAAQEGAARSADPVVDDPMGTVDSFLQRSRKEADDSIKALTQEAEALRSRLQKVEAALGRWQAVSGALNQDGKLRWRGPEPESASQLEPVSTPKEVPTLAPVGEQSAEMPAIPPAATPSASAEPVAVPLPEAVTLPPPTIPQPK